MQTCTKCHASSPDAERVCTHCGAVLAEFSQTAVALHRLQANGRVKAIRVTVAQDACPACQDGMATYTKNQVPALPHPGCSHPLGCRCFYEPVLSETAIVGKRVV